MADKMMRRVRSDLPWANDLNRWADTLLGNTPGRIKLWGDGGNELDLIDGTVISANNYPLDVRSDVGYHGRFRDSSDARNVLEILDAGVAIDGTLDVTGAVTFDGNVTLGDAAGDTITVNGTLVANASASFNGDVALGNAAGDDVTVNGTSTFAAPATFDDTVTLDGATTANANVTLTGSSVLTLPNGSAASPSLVVGNGGGLFRVLDNTLGFSTGGAERARLSSTGLAMAAATPITLPNNTGLQLTESGGGQRVSVVMDASDITIFGHSGNSGTIVRGGGVKLQFGTSTVFEVGGGAIGFYGTSPIVKPTVSGSRGGNAALADLLTELANLGLITDSTSA